MREELKLNHIYQGHVLEILKTFPDESINCCITSPPYWALRDYGIKAQIWDGDEKCEHDFVLKSKETGQTHWNTGGKVVPYKEREKRNGGTVKQGFCINRLRPVVKITQKTISILYAMQKHLKCGTIIKTNECSVLQINNNKGVITFVDKIAKFCFLKQKQLYILKKVALFLAEKGKHNYPYTKEELSFLLNLRDQIFELNKKTRGNIKQKYPKKTVLKENAFIKNIQIWQIKRREKGIKALNIYQKNRKKRNE